MERPDLGFVETESRWAFSCPAGRALIILHVKVLAVERHRVDEPRHQMKCVGEHFDLLLGGFVLERVRKIEGHAIDATSECAIGHLNHLTFGPTTT
jgi:hypothetical protein